MAGAVSPFPCILNQLFNVSLVVETPSVGLLFSGLDFAQEDCVLQLDSLNRPAKFSSGGLEQLRSGHESPQMIYGTLPSSPYHSESTPLERFRGPNLFDSSHLSSTPCRSR